MRICFIGAVWSFVYFSLLYLLLKQGWNFDALNLKHWRIISNYWNDGYTIKATDWLFFIIILAAIPVWIMGWRKMCKVSLMRIIFFPILWYHDYQERKYAQMPKSVVLKNMGGKIGAKQSPKQALEEMIANRMPKEKEKKDLNSNKIRSSVEEKSRSFHEKFEG